MDSAFPSAAYPSMITEHLRIALGAGRGNPKMSAELARRIAVDAGDRSRATAGERLHGHVGARVLKENGGDF